MPDQSFAIFDFPAIGEAKIAEMATCVRLGWLDTGPRAAQFEQGFATYQKFAPIQVTAVNSCIATLHVSRVTASHPRSENPIHEQMA